MYRALLVTLVTLTSTSAFGQTNGGPVLPDQAPGGNSALAFELATASGVCGDPGVETAEFVTPEEISVTCNEDATGFVPLAGGLAPLLLGGAAAAAALAATAGGGGSSTPDTQ